LSESIRLDDEVDGRRGAGIGFSYRLAVAVMLVKVQDTDLTTVVRRR